MATKKKMLQAAAGNATGGGPLDITDVFSTYLYEGNGGSQVIENGINIGQSFGSGSVEFDGSQYLTVSTELSLSGNFTAEAFVYKAENNVKGYILGGNSVNNQFYIDANNYLGIYDGSSELISTSPIPIGQWVHVAMTRSGSTVKFYIGGENFGSVTTSATLKYGHVGRLDPAGSNQQWVGNLSNVRVVDGSVVYSANFTPPTAPLTAVTNTSLLTLQTSDPFVDNSTNGYTITQNGNPQATTFGPFDAAEAGEGGMVWLKSRDLANNYLLFDTERGATYKIETNTTLQQANDTDTLTAFNSNGFSLGDDLKTNTSGDDLVSWTFRKAKKFFDVVTYTGTGTTGLVLNHALGCEVGTVFIKRTDAANNWYVHHRSVGGTQHLTLDGTGAATSYGGTELTTSTTSITINMANNITNASGGTYVAYLFAHNDGDGEFGPDGDADVIKCGSYTGNGSANGPEIDLGFEPQLVMIKSVDDGGHWLLIDVMRGTSQGTYSTVLRPNTSDPEANTLGIWGIDILPNGFKPNQTQSQYNTNGSQYIYMAIRRGPLAVPEDATEVFAPYLLTAIQSPMAVLGSPVDMTIHKYNINSSTQNVGISSRLTAGKYMFTNTTDAEATSGLAVPASDATAYDYQTGVGNGVSLGFGDDYTWMWKRAPGYFDVVAFTSQASGSTKSFSHNLTVAPEMVWFKNRPNSDPWLIYHSALGLNKYLVLNTNAAEATEASWISTPSATEVTGIKDNMTYNNSTYIAYLFASLPGISKVGSYTGNGTSQTIDCGFTTGARFVLIKNKNAVSDWLVYDTVRGITTGNDPFLRLNSTAAQSSFDNLIEPDTSGFKVRTTDDSINSSGDTFIFYAIA
jgi:hypothetical protein